MIDCHDDILDIYSLSVYFKSDNGPQVASDEFQDYCRTTTALQSDNQAQASGEVERQKASLLKRTQIERVELRDGRNG